MPNKVLIIDDDQEILDDFRHYLTNRVNAVYCNSPLEAMGTFKPGIFSLAVIDLVMPGINGVELSKHLLSLDPHLLVLIYSGIARTFEDQILTIPKTRPVSEVADVICRMLMEQAA